MKQTRDHIRNSPFSGRTAQIIGIPGLLVFILLQFYFSPAPRGSDQYWNIGNVNRVVHQDGLFRTNNIFPAGLPDSLSDIPRPWIQNRPVVYIAIAFAEVFGDPQFSWVLLNLFCFLAIMLILYRLIHRESSVDKPLMIFTLLAFLYMPLNFYLGMQALPEPFNELVLISITLILVSDRNLYLRSVGTAILTGLMIYQRDNFLLLIPVVCLFFLFFEKNRRTKFLSFGIFVLVTVSMVLVKPRILPAHTVDPIPVLSLVAEVRKGNSNMVNYLFTDLPVYSSSEFIKILWGKSIDALSTQFKPGGEDAVFRHPVNLLFLVYSLLLFRYRKQSLYRQKIIFLTGTGILLHFATIMVFENQYRFSSVLIPLLLLCNYWFITEMDSRSRKISLGVYSIILTAFFAAGIFIGQLNLKEARTDQEFIAEIRNQKTLIGEEPVLIPYYGGRSLLPGYAISPNYAYYFASHMSKEKLWADARRLGASLIIYREDLSIATELKPLIIQEIDLGNKHRLARLRISE